MFQIGLGMIAVLPVTMMTAMVSPIARPIPRMIAAAIPERAAGTMTRLIVCQRVAPVARDPSRYSMGTELIASSETLIIVGSVMIPRRIDPASQVCPLGMLNAMRMKVLRTIIPKNPYTTDGMPASSSVAGFRMLFIRGEASSEI